MIKQFLFVKKSTVIFTALFLLLFSIAPWSLITNADFSLYTSIMIVVFWMIIIAGVFYLLVCDRRIIISSDGVVYRSLSRTHQLRWEEIKEIGVIRYAPTSVTGTASFLCVSPRTGISGKRIQRFSEDCIYIRFRSSVSELMEKYWGQPIKKS